MIEFNLFFYLSQAIMFIAMIFDFLGFQFKKRKYTFACFIISASLISIHYFLLDKFAAGILVFCSVLRFITCYHTTNKKFMYFFIVLNSTTVFFTFTEFLDLLFLAGSLTIVVGNFQKDNALMRRIMMVGTSLIIIYNIIIFTPMGVLVEGLFLLSNFIGYYRHYINKKIKIIEKIKKFIP